jgi:hypothetical protein
MYTIYIRSFGWFGAQVFYVVDNFLSTTSIAHYWNLHFNVVLYLDIEHYVFLVHGLIDYILIFTLLDYKASLVSVVFNVLFLVGTEKLALSNHALSSC